MLFRCRLHPRTTFNLHSIPWEHRKASDNTEEIKFTPNSWFLSATNLVLFKPHLLLPSIENHYAFSYPLVSYLYTYPCLEHSLAHPLCDCLFFFFLLLGGWRTLMTASNTTFIELYSASYQSIINEFISYSGWRNTRFLRRNVNKYLPCWVVTLHSM